MLTQQVEYILKLHNIRVKKRGQWHCATVLFLSIEIDY